MKATLDEGVPDDIVEPLTRLGARVDPFAAEWRGFSNGILLAAVEQGGYELLLTSDKNMGFQVNLRRLRLAILALPTNRRVILMPRVADIAATMTLVRAGQALTMGMDGRRFVRAADATGAVVTDDLPRLPPFWR